MRKIFLFTMLSCFSPWLSSAQTQPGHTTSKGASGKLKISSSLMVTATGVNGTSFCAPNGSATANVTGGTSPYYYLWNTGSTEAIITNLDAGTYRVTVTDASSTSVTGSVSITNAYPIIVNASATNETGLNAHNGTATALPTGGIGPYSFAWSNGSAAFMVVNLAPGVYTVTITDASGCTATENVIVNAFGCPVLSIGANLVNPPCYGVCNGSIQIHAVGNGTPPYSYLWSNGTIGPLLTDLCPGYVSASVIDDNGCGAAETFLITQPSQVFAGAMSSGETGPATTDGKAWAIPYGGTGSYTYHWNTSSTDSLITGLIPGMYTVTVSDANACSATQTVTVNMFGCTTVDGNSLGTSCFGICDGSITVTLNNPLPPVMYLWENGSTLSPRTGLCAGSYSVTATDAAGCSASGIFSVTQPFPLNANSGNTDETATHANTGIAWSAPIGGTAPYSYLWSNGSVDSLITNLSPGAYFLTVTDANGCTDQDFALISAFQCIGSHTFLSVQPTCHASCDGNASAIISDTTVAISYLWSTGETTSSISNLCAGAYGLTITNEDLGCIDDSFTFELHPPDSLGLIVDQITHITDSTTASVSIHAQGGTNPYSYHWTGPGGFTSTSKDINVILPGNYFIVITDAHGCVLMDTIVIEDNSTVGIPEPKQFEIEVYPNPARDRLFIKTFNPNSYTLQIINPEGRIIYASRDEKEIDLQHIGAGIYILKISSAEKYFIEPLVIFR
ncbi:MAG: T9SS type A sorting domain-containing protein [Saprospiraceae bacterium]|uniref:T9SS type A sorting domain-containing protein n=1 Tax=Candidatus Opimibacter skivensis TaxID=2982028 RepID=A0A9D7SS22_9BACT|nr:T9SS type A sorting domain-containing protein [Candidatus Opimibacter skivensis]